MKKKHNADLYDKNAYAPVRPTVAPFRPRQDSTKTNANQEQHPFLDNTTDAAQSPAYQLMACLAMTSPRVTSISQKIV